MPFSSGDSWMEAGRFSARAISPFFPAFVEPLPLPASEEWPPAEVPPFVQPVSNAPPAATAAVDNNVRRDKRFIIIDPHWSMKAILTATTAAAVKVLPPHAKREEITKQP